MGRARKSATRATPGRGGKTMRNASRLSIKKKSKPKPAAEAKQKQGKQRQQGIYVIPFHPSDRILLVGEGDFSFSASLAAHHGCQRLLATCYDSEEELHRKYPQAGKHIAKLTASGQSLDGLASSKSGSCAAGIKRKRDEHEDGNENDSSETAATGTAANSSNGKREEEDQGNRAQFPKVLFSVDARKLGASGGGGKVVKKGILRGSGSTTTTSSAPGRGTAAAEKERKEGPGGGPWDVICFNFPHVGGLSTDVNRQVRANQELLVSFFNASVPLLSAPLPSAEDLLSDDDDGTEGEDGSAQSDFENEESESAARRKSDKSRLKDRREPGQIVVTLFEGEPYTLWNIRDLARHAGLRVVTSFKFPWASYPGYAHARTLGEIESKHGGRGGWKGEDREARTYVFERKDHELLGPKRSRKGRGLDNDDDDK